MPSMQLRSAVGVGWTALSAALLLAAVGCTPFMTETPRHMTYPSGPSAPTVKTGGACMELMEAQKPALGREEFIDKIGTLLGNHHPGTAAEWVRRYPDVAWDVLRSADLADAANPTVRFIAKVHDQQCCVNGTSTTWLSMLDDRATRPAVYKTFDAACAKMREVARHPKMAETANLSIAVPAPHRMLDIEASRLTGEALLQNNRAGEAAAILSRGYELARNVDPYVSTQISLLVGEAQRRHGQKVDAAATWQHALMSAQALLDATPPTADPGLWARIAALRPVDVDWPPLGKATTPDQDNSLAEAYLWKKIGQWRLDRAELQPALFAFKRAETLAPSTGQRDELQLLQAKALLQMNQEAAAVTLLARLADLPDQNVVAQALGLLGSIKLKQGDKTVSLALLQRAIESRAGIQWPGRAEAQADLGLAYLMNGDEAKGLRCLHEAQASLEKEGSSEMLMHCLANEARYLDQADKKDQAARVQQKINLVEEAGRP